MAKYVVCLVGVANVHGRIVVTADSEDEAERIALEHTGDVEWTYDGVRDDEVEVITASTGP